MLNLKRRFLALACTAGLAGSVFAFVPADAVFAEGEGKTVEDAEPNNSKEDAQSFNPGDALKGEISDSDEYDYYSFKVENPGKFNLDVKTNIESYRMRVFDADGVVWYSGDCKKNAHDSIREDLFTVYLEAGAYFVQMTNSDVRYSGEYSINTSFVAIDSSEKEPNDKIENATSFKVGDTIRGMISDDNDDEYDYYQFSGAAGKVTFDVTSYLESYKLKLYNKEGSLLFDSKAQNYNENDGFRKDIYTLYLDDEDYFLCLTNTGGCTGDYLIETSCEEIKVTEQESNGRMQDANAVKIGDEISGMISCGDEYDYFSFDVSEDSTIQIDVKSNLEGYSVRLYDKDGRNILVKDLKRNTKDEYREDVFEQELKAGKYILCMTNKYSASYTGEYKINLTQKDSYTGLKKGPDGMIHYYTNGMIDKEFKGYADYAGSSFYVMDGVIDIDLNGVMIDPNSAPDYVWYFCANGQVQTQHVGLAEYDSEWFYIENGKVAVEMNKFVEYDGGLFAVAAGRIVSEYSGLMQDPENPVDGDWYFFANGQAQTQYTGLTMYDDVWFYVVNGKLAVDYTGPVDYDGATFNVENGMVK